MPIVKFLPANKEVEVAPDETLLAAALREGIPIASQCVGMAVCVECKVKVLDGIEHLSKMEYPELSRLGTTFHITGERLACQTKVSGPVTVQVLMEQATDKKERARRKALAQAKENAARRAERANSRRS